MPAGGEGKRPAALVAAALAAAGIDVDASSRRRAEYSYDSSNYRVPPLAVAFPRSVADVVRAVSVCREHDTRVLARGGGTGMTGAVLGPGVVLDLSRHLDRVGAVDPVGRTVAVEPGVVLSHLTATVEAATDGALTFAPDPSSRTRASVGGALGNDACGNHSVRHGRTSEHTVELDVITSDGARLTAYRAGVRASDPADRHSTRRAGALERDLRALCDRNRALLRTELGRIPRQVSGYQLQNLLPENGFDLARALVGTEGSCAVVVGARMRLVERPPAALLVVLGYPDVAEAARDVPEILTHDPAAVEGVDDAILATMRWRRGPEAVAGMPRGRAWLYVELDGPDTAEVEARAAGLLARLRAAGRMLDGRVVTEPAERAVLWRVREDGAGLSSRLAPDVAGERPESWPGWEDAAVAPARLADYLVDLRALLNEHALTAVMYGHFGAGCMHVRIGYDLRTPEGVATFERFTQAAAELVVAHGGSLSGEHGDGRARSALLRVMYSPELLAVFEEFRRLWDPHDLLGDGSMADPQPVTAHLALAGVPDRDWDTAFAYPRVAAVDGFVSAAQACIGVGRCRTASGGVMCPSFRATRDEKDSTRGRARVLQEMIRSAPSTGEGWRSDDVRASLDLCLGCKACSTDCPTGVDMATFRSEVLHHHYDGRVRPVSHYALGWLPRWLELSAPVRGLAARALAMPLSRQGLGVLGLTTKRALPPLASADAWARAAAAAGAARPGSGVGDVVLFVDTFTKGFRPGVAGSAAAVLAGAGERPECAADACCGLTWISTGQLDEARRRLIHLTSALDDDSKRPVVVLEPSCASALRHDLPRLVPTEAAARVARRVESFAAHVGALGNRLAPPAGPLPGRVVVQTHCHEYASFGAATQRRALEAVGLTGSEVVEATGCCGVAGTFGFEADHYELSLAVAEQGLVPALDATGGRCGTGAPGIPVLTDGFSCAQQVAHLAPARSASHLAQLLDPREVRRGATPSR